jgi:hypothetical protein
MSDNFRPIEAAENAAENATQKARSLVSWLPSPKECDHCSALCYAEREYVDSQAQIEDIWKCRESEGGCGARYYRDEDW